MESKHQYILIAIIAFVCYFNTLFGTFVFDDSEAIVKNKDVIPSNPIQDVFKNDFWGTDISLNLSHKSYRPLTILTYRLNVLLADKQLNAAHFHATNIILYMMLCVLTLPLFKLFISKQSKLSKDDNTAYLSSMLFTIHPVHSEVVASLVGRADILSALLFLISILLYRRVIQNNSIVLFVVVVLVIAAAVLCKETAITAIALCSIYDIFYTNVLRNGVSKALQNKPFIYRNLGLVLSGLIIMYLRLLIMDFQGPIFTKIDNPAAYSDNLFTKILTYNYVYLLNFLLLLWPYWLCFDWSMGCIPLIEDICDIRIIFVTSFWLFSALSLFTIVKSYFTKNISTATILGIALIVLPFLPASNLFLKVGFVIAERTLLLPSAGFCFLVVLGLNKLAFQQKKQDKRLLYFTFYFICMIFAFRTIYRNIDWLTEGNLFESALEVCPLNAKVHYNVAKVAADKNNKIRAVYEYNKAIELNPDYEQAMNNLANLLREDKRFEEAEILLRKALIVRPNFAAAWMNLGIVLTNLNQPIEAEICYLKAISFREKYPDCYYNLGNLYLDLKRNDESLKAWNTAVKYRPKHTAAWSNTLVLLDSLQKYDEVLAVGKTALRFNPTSPALHFSLANTLGKLRQFNKAEKHFLEALNFNPYNALYYSNLGVLYHRWGKLEKARDMYKKALQIDPFMKSTENNLRKLLNAQFNNSQY